MLDSLKYSTYLFDFDGTLVDSMPVFAAVMTGILKDHGVRYPKNILEIITPMGYAGSAKYFRQLGMDKSRLRRIAVSAGIFTIAPAVAIVISVITLAKDLGVKKVRVVANKVRDEKDEQFVRDSIPAEDLLGMIHYNLEIMDADRQGKSPYDFSPTAIEEIRKIKAILDRDDS